MATLFLDIPVRAVTLTNGADEFMLHVSAPSNHAIKIWSATFTTNGVSGTAAHFQIDVVRRTGSDDGASWTTITPVKKSPGRDETPTGTYQSMAGTIPTGSVGSVAAPFYVHPQGGLSLQDPVEVPGGGGAYIRVRNNSGGDLGGNLHVVVEE